MFKVIHEKQLDYFSSKEEAISYYSNHLNYDGIVNMLSLMKGNDDSLYVGAYGSPSEWEEYRYKEEVKDLVHIGPYPLKRYILDKDGNIRIIKK